MPATDVCPSAAELERMLSGSLFNADTERLTRHLDRCERCAALVGRRAGNAPITRNEAQSDAVTLPPSPPSPAAADTPFLDPPRAAGELGWLTHYRILKQLGEGGMGLVFLAEDTLLARLVALKVMLPDLAANSTNRDRFLREARAAASLTHDHVVTIYQVSESNGAPFLAMQLLEGESLESHLARRQKLAHGYICRIGRETALGLAAAHAKGLIHRDIKPANLWLEAPKGRVKVLDFGLVRGAGDARLTGTGMVLGTPSYMAPEQARGLPLDSRSDLWSLGVVLYRLCSNRLPFRSGNLLAVLAATAMDEPPPLLQIAPDTPPELAALVMQLLAKKPADRPQTAQEVADQLLKIERTLATTARSSRTVTTPMPDQPDQTEATTAWMPPITASRTKAVGSQHVPGSPGPKRRWPLVAALAGVLAVLAAYPAWLIVHGGTRKEVAKIEIPEAAPAVVSGDKATERKEGDKEIAKNAVPAVVPGDNAALAPPLAAVNTNWRSHQSVQGFTVPTTETGFKPLVAYINDGKTLLVVDSDGAWQWPTAGGAWRVQTIDATCRQLYQATIAHGTIAPDGTRLALVLTPANGRAGSTKLVVWDLTTGRPITAKPPESNNPARAIAFMGLQQLGTGSAVGIQWWVRAGDATGPQGNNRLGVGPVTALAGGPTVGVMAIGTEIGEVRVRDRNNQQQLWIAQRLGSPVASLAWSLDGRRLVSTTRQSGQLWDAVTGRRIADLPIQGHGLAVSSDSRLIAAVAQSAAGSTGGLVLLDGTTGRVLATSAAEHAGPIPALAFSPDGRTLASLGRDGVLKLWMVPAAVP